MVQPGYLNNGGLFGNTELNPSVRVHATIKAMLHKLNSANESSQFLPRVNADNGLTAWWLNRKTASKKNMTRMFADHTKCGGETAIAR